MQKIFDPLDAFKRNLGWITPDEAQKLSNTRVAIAGVGGVGGHYCEILARLGVGSFHIADPDFFEVANFNRQNAAGLSTVGRMKVEVLKELILDINPLAEVTTFKDGINANNYDEFLSGVDIYLDGLDFFLINERIDLFFKLRERKIPGITLAPIGMGAATLAFTNTSMSFADYFGLKKDQPARVQRLRFLLGLAPSLMHIPYLADRSFVDIDNMRVPSLPIGPYLCAGIACSLTIKIVLNRGPVLATPWSLHFDSYLNKYKKSYTWWGFRNPLQQLKFKLLERLTRTP